MLAPRTTPRRRLVLLGCSALVVVVGLAVRTVPGPVGDAGGGILYAVLMYLLIAMITPSWSSARIGAAAVILCTAIELMQLTPLPSSLGAVLPPVRYVLGTTFVWTDLVTGAAGALLAMLGDGVLLHRRQRLRGRPGQEAPA